MRLPEALAEALEREAQGVGQSALAAAASELSDRYRGDRGPGRVFMSTPAHRLAYAVVRMPATLAAAAAALREVTARIPGFAPRTVLDVGAGPGTASWAAAGAFPTVERFTLVERDGELAALGARLAAAADARGLREAEWVRADLRGMDRLPDADLVIAAYVLNELGGAAAQEAALRLYEAARGVLVIVEPGTSAAFGPLRAARTELLAAGASLVAPCPHAGACPAVGKEWCHFAERVERTSLHRRLKGGGLGHEDEKFSYLAVAREPAPLPRGRVVRHPVWRKGHAYVDLCTADGLAREVVSKHDRDLYRGARRSRWGSAWPPEAGGAPDEE